jgi:hypothetical protein
MADHAVEIILAEELRLAKNNFEAAMENDGKSPSDINTAVDAYASALFRFSAFVNEYLTKEFPRSRRDLRDGTSVNYSVPKG